MPCPGQARPRSPISTVASVLLGLSLSGWFATADAAQNAGATSPGVPVRLDGEALFYVREPLGPFSAAERAKSAEQRIARIAADPFYSDDLFNLREEGNRVLALYRDQVVGVVSAADVAGAPDVMTQASERLQSVKEAIRRHRERLLPQARLRAAVILTIATFLLLALLLGLGRLYRTQASRIEAQRPQTIATAQVRALRLVRIAFMAVAILLYIETAFSVIPLTRGYGLAMLDYIVEPLRILWAGFLRHIADFFFILVVVVLTRYALKTLYWFLKAVSERTISTSLTSPEWALPLYKIARILVLAIAAVTIYPYIPGSNTDAFKGIGLVGGALFTLGASGTAGNFIGGLVLIFTDTFRLGDRVKIGDVNGHVIETNLLLTRVRTAKNEVITIPNSAVMGGQVLNYSTKARNEGLILHTEVTIGYDAPWRKVHELLIDAARRTPQILEDPAPFVFQTALNDFFVTYQINGYTRNTDVMNKTYSALHQNIQDAFNAAGVEIMSPHYASVRDGNAATIPEPHRTPSDTQRRFVISVDQPRNSL